MSALLTTLATRRPTGDDALARYAAIVIPLIEAANGTVLCRGVFREAMVGDDGPEFIAVIRFPDADSAREMLASAAYRAAIPDRQLAFSDLRTFISDVF